MRVDTSPGGGCAAPAARRDTLEGMNATRRATPLTRAWKVAESATLVLVVLAFVAMVVLVATDHPHRAVLVLVATLYAAALLRAVWLPYYRPWFASRHRWSDVAVYVALASLLWYLSPYTATMGVH